MYHKFLNDYGYSLEKAFDILSATSDNLSTRRKVKINSKEGVYTVSIPLPGFQKEDVELTYLESDKAFHVKGELKNEEVSELVEFKKFHYSIDWENSLEDTTIDSSLKNGLFVLKLKKKEVKKENKKKLIEIGG